MAEELIAKIKQIVELVTTNHLKSISVSEGDFSCQIESLEEPKRQILFEELPKQGSQIFVEESLSKDDQYTYIKAPLVGTFYRSSSPNSDPFIELGDMVQPRETLCIIEAMKVMNEIASEVKGRIIEIYPENGQIVDFNHVLFKIEPISEED
jgi:acetyl-CoA carboxylase biotin carboxyl carrier protein